MFVPPSYIRAGGAFRVPVPSDTVAPMVTDPFRRYPLAPPGEVPDALGSAPGL